MAAARRKQHLSSLQYYCALNALQYRKRMAMMEPMLGFAHGQVGSPSPRRRTYARCGGSTGDTQAASEEEARAQPPRSSQKPGTWRASGGLGHQLGLGCTRRKRWPWSRASCGQVPARPLSLTQMTAGRARLSEKQLPVRAVEPGSPARPPHKPPLLSGTVTSAGLFS